jgi:hypothetical protein
MIGFGRRIGARRLAEEGESSAKGVGAVESAVFALFGLVLAFLFSGALARFDARRSLVVEEANDIGTAWLRVDLLPKDVQPHMRDLFRGYLDSRIATYQKLPDLDAALREITRSGDFQKQIWNLAVDSSPNAGAPPATMLLLPALNAMFDITTTRTEAVKVHPPAVIFVMLGVLSLACSLFAGYDMANRVKCHSLHTFAFALVVSITVYVIIDLEFPRLGLIRMTDSDELLVSLRKSFD